LHLDYKNHDFLVYFLRKSLALEKCEANEVGKRRIASLFEHFPKLYLQESF
jgi:hypothetical protein